MDSKECTALEGLSPASAVDEIGLTDVVESLCEMRGILSPRRHVSCRQVLPSREVLVSVIEDLRSVLFPGYFGTSDLTDESMPFHMGATLDRLSKLLVDQVKRGLCFVCGDDPANCPRCDRQAAQIVRTFISRLPEVGRRLTSDVQAAYEGDPAATSPDEAIFAYPGIVAITNHRLAHELHRLGLPLIPRIISEHAHSVTGIDIHPGAQIGDHFFIDHGTGVVIGETTEIGSRVRIYQGVTLGAKSFPLDAEGNPIKGIKRHPVVEDDVIIYSGATILGRVRIGRGAVIGGNVWLTHDVAPGSRITQAVASEETYLGGTGI